jgi:hypothetical protein
MDYTNYLRLAKPPFDTMPWDAAINGDLDIIDGFDAQFMSVPNFVGSWQNATAYITGQVALDTSNSSMWVAAVSHTSAAQPTTFAQDRAAHPGYWNAGTSPVGFMPITGGTFTGPVTLSGPPTAPLHAATKAYVDAGGSGGFLPISGGAITGNLSVAGTHSVGGTHSVAGNSLLHSTGITGDLSVSNGAITNTLNIGPTVIAPWSFAQDGSNNHIMQHSSGWYDIWNSVGGARIWVGTSVSLMTLNGSGGLTIADAAAIKPGGGAWIATSDARIKDVIGDYTSGLDAIVALRPVRYKYKDNWRVPDDEVQRPHKLVAERGTEFIGLVAQDTEATMPEMISTTSVELDGKLVHDLRLIDMTALPLAIVNAIKELVARIEVLEEKEAQRGATSAIK